MKLRAPSVPLITVDPYFSVWSPADKLTDEAIHHWTNNTVSMLGIVEIDDKAYRFMGVNALEPIPQTDLQIDALSTEYTFETETVRIRASFLAPMLPDDLDLISRPVNYLKLTSESKDGKDHSVKFTISVSEEICLDDPGQSPVVREKVSLDGLKCMRMGNSVQNILNKSGDNVLIDWGYFYLAVDSENAEIIPEDVTYIDPFKPRFTVPEKNRDIEAKEKTLPSVTAKFEKEALVLFAYDDIYSLIYFEKQIKAWWNRNGKTIEEAICEAAKDYETLVPLCKGFSDKLTVDAIKAGGEKYADMLSLAYRQVFAAHKIACDDNGDMIFVSKECYSNGCAATVDVSYPSIPMFLYYNPEFVKGMMRPILRFTKHEKWPYDFAPHDMGQYPILNYQVYGYNSEKGEYVSDEQMPVEECGNLLIMAAATAVAQGDLSFVEDYMDIWEQFATYLIKYGTDPENQLCTDDFAGHLAHNCNLSLKAIMGIASLGIIYRMAGNSEREQLYMAKAKEMADIWVKTAANGDGSFRLAFDRPGTFSMKYNAVWDKLYGTELFDKSIWKGEIASNIGKINPYGMPLDNRAMYTKSDWLVWTATLAQTDDEFRTFIEPLWNMFNYTRNRVPMTDWYDTVSALQHYFQNRTVQGGLFIKLLEKGFHEKSRIILGK